MYAAHVHVHVWMLRFVFPCDLVYSLPTVTFQECQIFLHAHCNNAGTMIHVLHVYTCTCIYMYIMYIHSSYITLIGIHELHGRMHPQLTILLAVAWPTLS